MTPFTQGRLSPGDVVLAMMLSSDQTLVSSNGRQKAWPVYLKLGKGGDDRRGHTEP